MPAKCLKYYNLKDYNLKDYNLKTYNLKTYNLKTYNMRGFTSNTPRPAWLTKASPFTTANGDA